MKALWWTLLVMGMSRNAEPGAVNITTSSDHQSIFADGLETQRDPRFLFPFTFISVAADECTTLSTTVTTGVCQAASSCPQLGGTASGTCAGGFGVCCLFTQTCGETTTRNGSSFINPSSPSSDTTVSNCVTTVQLLDNNICQLRLDFVSFELEPPNVNGVCETDFMTITGSANDATIPKLCGSNTGKHSECSILV
ncbi:uncharacterized protein LOC108670404 [Hyalella azteca]|uniref:Uncharacterized protein LOC108670404 n=1 Tax=Hyalella azteca TaxID=294128 RepID=A0A8B7NJ61_HYAAZ|nr:uncharacterized protein LOC108670404 [Hyalella azteca]